MDISESTKTRNPSSIIFFSFYILCWHDLLAFLTPLLKALQNKPFLRLVTVVYFDLSVAGLSLYLDILHSTHVVVTLYLQFVYLILFSFDY